MVWGWGEGRGCARDDAAESMAGEECSALTGSGGEPTVEGGRRREV